ncbi:hypothetical protein [Kitasatospora sp. NRRL B-11411]|uniref:hypothetical protein n=1 Tax=Kitasatospora sp. NRRL B-11411 TaxID=1463822 RepID=UPI0004C30421|nr:hypothetical protein [Kitasatospora sp. NRRL B-11411]
MGLAGVSPEEQDRLREAGLAAGATLVVLAVLVALTGLLDRTMVAGKAVSWEKGTTVFWKVLGGTALFAAAALLPIYLVYAPFRDGTWLTWVFPVCAGFGVLLPIVARGGRCGERYSGKWRRGERCPGWLRYGSWRKQRGWEPGTSRAVMPGWTAGILLVLWAFLLVCFFTFGRTHRMAPAAVALAVLGISATATAFGQNLSIQVEAQDAKGQADAAASDYILGRVVSLGTRPVDGGMANRPTELAKLATEDWSAIPAGNVAGAVARILYAIRPGLTWRAKVTTVDGDRVAVALSRNSRHAYSTVISRPELGLPAWPDKIPDLEKNDRARAQLLTAATACILVRLGRCHHEVRTALCGAGKWRAVAQHAIATEPALMREDTAGSLKLLKQAIDAEPGYGPARVAYLSTLFSTTERRREDRLRISRMMASVVKLAKGSDDPAAKVRDGWTSTCLQALYARTAMLVNCCLTDWACTRRCPRYPQLAEAEDSSREFTGTCTKLLKNPDGELHDYVEEMRRSAEILGEMVELFREDQNRITAQGPTWQPTALGAEKPIIAYEYACRIALAKLCGQLDTSGEGVLKDYIVFSAERKGDLWSDPSFALLRQDAADSKKMRSLLGVGKPEMLDIAPFKQYAGKLKKIGLTTFEQFRDRARIEREEELAGYLSVSGLRVRYLGGVARIAALHDSLREPEVVGWLVEAGITGADELLSRARGDRAALVAQLKEYADGRVPQCASVLAEPEGWVREIAQGP